MTFNEGHCISIWGGDDFCPEYQKTKLLHWLLPHTPFHIASATQPPLIHDNIQNILQMPADSIKHVHLSNDWPNIHLMVAEMQYSVKSMQDLDCVLILDPE